jgi:hypothetical protein
MKHDHGNNPLLAALVLFASIMVTACGGGGNDSAASAVVDPEACTTGPALTPVDTALCRGKANFHDRTLAGLGGNGRACSDCHMDSENFQLTPAAAQVRFATMTATGIDDPLFRAIDANDFRINGAAAHDFANLMENGLIRVSIPLPPNVKLLDCGATVPCPASARRPMRPLSTSGARCPRSSTSRSPDPMASRRGGQEGRTRTGATSSSSSSSAWKWWLRPHRCSPRSRASRLR